MFGSLLKFLYFDIGFIVRYWFWKLVIHSMGGSVGKDVKFYGGVRIVGNGPDAIHIGDGVRILRGVTMSTTPAGKIHVGEKVHIGENNIIFSDIGITIGDNVIIGSQNIIVDFDHIYKNVENPINQQGINKREIIIEEDVWISSHCVITKGVRVGKGAVIGAGSVVNKDVPAYSVAVGVPVRVIKKRGDTSKA
jgi:acetyltransferase-like isoleucine patch superfamily enzyme